MRATVRVATLLLQFCRVWAQHNVSDVAPSPHPNTNIGNCAPFWLRFCRIRSESNVPQVKRNVMPAIKYEYCVLHFHPKSRRILGSWYVHILLGILQIWAQWNVPSHHYFLFPLHFTQVVWMRWPDIVPPTLLWICVFYPTHALP